MRVNAGVGAEHHGHAGAYRTLEGLALGQANSAFLVQALLLGAVGGAGGQDVVVVVDVHGEPSLVLHRQLQRGIAGQTAVLNGVDARQNGRADAFVTMCVRCHLQVQHVRFIGNGLHFLERQLLPAHGVAEREHATGGADLDGAGAVLMQPANARTCLVRSSHHRRTGPVHGRRQAVVVAVATNGANGPAGRHDAWAGNPAAVDGLPQTHVGEVGRAHVTHGGETDVQGLRGVRHAHGGPEGVRVAQVLVATHLGERGQVHVHIDEAGQQIAVAEVDMTDALAPLHRARVGDGSDAALLDEHRGVVHPLARGHIQQMPARDDGDRLFGRLGSVNGRSKCSAYRGNQQQQLGNEAHGKTRISGDAGC